MPRLSSLSSSLSSSTARSSSTPSGLLTFLVLTSALFSWVTMAGTAAARACWLPPVDAPVVDPFRPPPCTWCAGNRGLEYGTTSGAVVSAVAAGEVTFSGTVAGERYVVVRHADGRRATYGGLASSALRVGDAVTARAVVGVTAAHLHFGLRDGDAYVDPAPFLGRLVGRLRLVPDDGTAARAAPPPRLRCGRRRRLGDNGPDKLDHWHRP